MKLLIINGPNLNLLGWREPSIYGSQDFESYLEELRALYPEHSVEYRQSNVEGEIVNILHWAAGFNQKESDAQVSVLASGSGFATDKFDGIVLNAGGYTHTSVAIADAVAAIGIPAVEVHISNIMAREEFRKSSLLAPVCRGSVSGFGLDSYRLAIESFLK